jgi:hypothetical protein
VCAALLFFFCSSNAAAPAFGTVPIALVALTGWIAAVVAILIVPTWRTGYFSLFALFVLGLPALLGLVWSILGISDYHIVRESPNRPLAQQVSLDKNPEWLEARKDVRGSQRPYPIVVVAAEGGGVRAAYWAAAILGGVQDKDPFRCHVYAISGVSGEASAPSFG